MQLNNYQDRITLVHNALSDSYDKVILGTYRENQGGTFVKTEGVGYLSYRRTSVKRDMSSTTILMSDLASVVDFQKALLKIDIEGFEWRAMRCADRLFNKVFIPYVLMEWVDMIRQPDEKVKAMLQWFKTRGYEAFKMSREKLDTSYWKTWPRDVIFKHNTVS